MLAFDAPAEQRARSEADAAAAALKSGGFHEVGRVDAPFDGGVAMLVTALR